MRTHPLSIIAALVCFTVTGCGGHSSSSSTPTQPPQSQNADQRADALLAKLTQAEKVQLVAGGTPSDPSLNIAFPRGGGGYVPGIPALNIPALYIADGSVGVGNAVGPATALPSSIASAATWDTALAQQYGQVIGTELADYGMNVNLGGNTNLIGREPRDGRTFETKGEDPISPARLPRYICSASSRSTSLRR